MSAKVQSILVGAAPKSAAKRQKTEKQASFEYDCISVLALFGYVEVLHRPSAGDNGEKTAPEYVDCASRII